MKTKPLHKIIQYFFPIFYNDYFLRPLRFHHEGEQRESDKIAVFLIFPSQGLQESHLYSLRYIVESGYSPMVISNLPLSDADITRLLPLSWKVIQRENFGYDFGGYRDAVLDLKDKLLKIRSLVLFNDSTWFPIPGGMDWLRTAEENSANFVGATNASFLGRCRVNNYKRFKWKVRDDASNFHYGSFALFIKNPILKTQDFLTFWQNLRLSQGKGRTCKRGETGLTQWVLKMGHTHATTSDYRNFDQFLAKASDEDKQEMLENVLLAQDEKAARFFKRKNIRQNSGSLDIETVNAILRMIVARRGLGPTLPQVFLRDYNYSFLKKYAAKKGLESRAIMLKVIDEISEPMRSIMRSELALDE